MPGENNDQFPNDLTYAIQNTILQNSSILGPLGNLNNAQIQRKQTSQNLILNSANLLQRRPQFPKVMLAIKHSFTTCSCEYMTDCGRGPTPGVMTLKLAMTLMYVQLRSRLQTRRAHECNLSHYQIKLSTSLSTSSASSLATIHPYYFFVIKIPFRLLSLIVSQKAASVFALFRLQKLSVTLYFPLWNASITF